MISERTPVRNHLSIKKGTKVIGPLFLVTSAITMLLASFRPIYWDEIAYRISNSRFFIDGWRDLPSIYTICKSTDHMQAPWLWIPGRFLDGVLYALAGSPWGLRGTGIFLFCVWMTVCLFGLSKTHKTESKLKTLVLILSFCQFGILPCMLIWTRPENQIMIGLALFFFYPLLYRSGKMINSFLRAFLFILITLWFFPLHSQTVVFLPMVLASAYLSFSGPHQSKILCGGVLALTLAMGVVSLVTHSTKNSLCPEFQSSINLLMSILNIMPTEFIHDPWGALQSAIGNLGRVTQTFKLIQFADSYLNYWLPSDPHFSAFSRFVNHCMNVVFTCAVLMILVSILRQLKLRSLRQTVLPFCWIFCLFTLSALQKIKPMYSSILLITSVGTLVAHFSLLETNSFWKQAWRFLILLAILTSLMSHVLLIPRLGEMITAKTGVGDGKPLLASQYRGAPDSVDQPIKAVESLGEKCGLESNHSQSRLVLDDVSYFAFPRTQHPVLVNFNSMIIAGQGDTELRHFASVMQGIDSDGVIAACRLLPPSIRESAVSVDGYCCVSKQKLFDLAGKER